MRTALALLAFCATACAADERAADFASAARIDETASASHFRVRMSPSVYRASAQSGLGDLRVVNSEAEFVPFAFAPQEAEEVVPQTRALKLFPLLGDASRTTVEGLSLRVERSRTGTVVTVDAADAPRVASGRILGYVVEVPDPPQRVRALVLDWKAGEGFTGTVRVEASDDLKAWAPLARGPVIQLEHAGERLERKRVALQGWARKYLRVSFAGVPADFMLNAIAGELAPQQREPSRDGHAFDAVQDAERKNEYRFDTGSRLPVDRFRFELPQPNTVAPVQVFTRARDEDSWRLLAAATLYRLAGDGGEAVSPEIAVGPTTDRHWLLRVDQRSGGLGAGNVRLLTRWRPHEIVVAARGTAPFELLVGSKKASAAALPLATIVPGYREGETVPAAHARLGEIRTNASAGNKAGNPIASAREFAGSEDGRKWILWTVLIAGVLLLVWMAMRLMRELGKAPDPPKRN